MEPPKALPTTDEIYKLVKENNRMLKAMRRDAFIKGIFSFIWWVALFIVIPYFTWLWLKPYLDQVMHTYQQVQGTTNAVDAKLAGLPDFTKLWQQFMQQFTGAGK